MMIFYVLIFIFVLVERLFLSFFCLFFLFEIFLALLFLYCYELCSVFDFVHDKCRHVQLFLVFHVYFFG